tara:strand:- start:371 stop:565 length:195 start_codon:yes stop_codon:yes gene_type:complete
MPHKKKKLMKPVDNMASSDAPLQFLVKKDIETSKKIKPKDVFDGYKEPVKTKGKTKKNNSKNTY